MPPDGRGSMRPSVVFRARARPSSEGGAARRSSGAPENTCLALVAPRSIAAPPVAPRAAGPPR